MLKFSTRDRVEWDADQEKQAEQAVRHNSAVLLPSDKKGIRLLLLYIIIVFSVEYEQKADHFWDSFYMQHQNRSLFASNNILFP